MLEGKKVGQNVVVYDTDGYYMGVSIAEKLGRDGASVTYITAFDNIGPYMRFTLEEQRMCQTLAEVGVEVVSKHLVLGFDPGVVHALDHWAGRERDFQADGIVTVTQRNSDCAIYDQLQASPDQLQEAGIKGLFLIGDAEVPGLIAQSVFSGHRLGREIDSPDPNVPVPFVRERRLIGNGSDAELRSASIAVSV